MKILYYNWIQFDKKNNSGGGVNVYQKNLIDYLINNTEHEVYFLSAGIYYDLVSKKIRIVESKNVYGDRCHSYKLINSTCMAPVKAMYEDIDVYLKDMSVYQVFARFVKNHGFDVIHFNNIEGLPLNCLKIKRDFPNIKVIYSLHNYFMFCPQVNLFFNELSNCNDCEKGNKCCECLGGSIGKKQFQVYYRLDNVLEKMHLEKQSDNIKLFFKNGYTKLKKNHSDEGVKRIGTPEQFHKFRVNNVGVLNKYVDNIIAVSDRVKEIAVRCGVKEEKVKTMYIGTKVADDATYSYHGRSNEEYLTIGFMGYFEKIKGLEFLISSLESMSKETAKKIAFVCYARRKTEHDDEIIKRIESLKNKMAKVEYFDGYNHDELPEIMKNIDLGVVPVIWEDNLPQVAIEFAAYGVPVLSSNLGGAHELSTDSRFIFKANDQKDFLEKIENIILDNSMLNDYFKQSIHLNTVEEHIDMMLKCYL